MLRSVKALQLALPRECYVHSVQSLQMVFNSSCKEQEVMGVKGHKECFLHAERVSPLSLFEKEDKTGKKYANSLY